ncbi:hypothetical protein [Nonomuraea sp. NPDC050783]|uniref:hypothetical protein n=1 Tax=Nonomuraea sp. NPDC050783 TaxID=3154634 RepID=UPI0034674A60
MRSRAVVVLLGLGAVVAGLTSVGWVRAADKGSDLGGPIVVSPTPSAGPEVVERSRKAVSVPREVMTAEPVKLPAPRPGGSAGGGARHDDAGSGPSNDDAGVGSGNSDAGVGSGNSDADDGPGDDGPDDDGPGDDGPGGGDDD